MRQFFFTFTDQEEPSSGGRNAKLEEFSRKSKFEDDFEFIGGQDSWKNSNNNRIESNWEKEFEVMKSTSKTSQPVKDNWSNDFDTTAPAEQPKRSMPKRPDTLSSSASFDAKKYGSAKAISSDMLFGNDSNVRFFILIVDFTEK